MNSKKNNKTVSNSNTSIKIYALLSFLIVFLFYSQTIRFGLTNFDDNTIIEKIKESSEGGSFVVKAFTSDALMSHTEKFYRPIQSISYWLDLQISGENETTTLHFTNVLLFALISLTLFLLLKKLNFETRISFFASLIFCFHPLFVSSVAWIPARGDLFLTLFSLLSFLFFIRFIEQNKLIDLLITCLFFALAIFSKETAAFLPLLFLFYFYLKNKTFRVKREQILLAGVIFLIGFLWYYLRSISVCKVLKSNHFLRQYSGHPDKHTIHSYWIIFIYLANRLNNAPCLYHFQNCSGDNHACNLGLFCN
jgi:hypothetical protein